MSLNGDQIIERSRLKNKLSKWRGVAIFLLVITIILFLQKNSLTSFNISGGGGSYIGEISIKDVIFDDNKRLEKILAIKKNQNVKALIVNINSPGGTVAGSEAIYAALRSISESGIPVIAVLGDVAASGGYMVALGADKIIARNGTTTGSIGVLLEVPEITDLAQKIGVNFTIIKSSPLKASPSMVEKTSPEAHKAVESVINDSYNFFVGLVEVRRNLAPEIAKSLADGRVYTGKQAMENKLIDQIGGKEEAIKLLQSDYAISNSLSVKEIKLKDEKDEIRELFINKLGFVNYMEELRSPKIMAIWRP